MVAVASLPHLFKFQAAALEHRHILSQGQIDGQVLKAVPQGSRSEIIAKLSPLHIEVIPRIPAQRIGIGNHHITGFPGLKFHLECDSVHRLIPVPGSGFPTGQDCIAPVLGPDSGVIVQGKALSFIGNLLPVYGHLYAGILHIRRQEHRLGSHRLIGGILHLIGCCDPGRLTVNDNVQHLRAHRKALILLQCDSRTHIRF